MVGWIDVCVSYDNRDMIVLLSFMTSIINIREVEEN